MIFRNSLIIVLILAVTDTIAEPADVNDWITRCMDYTIHTKFDSALMVVDQQITDDSLNYRAHFYRAATLSSRMTHFENNDDEAAFIKTIDYTIEILEDKLSDTTGLDPVRHADYLFYLGSAYGYLAFYQGRNGKYFPALSNGLKSNSLLNMAVLMDSTRYDAFLGIGIFKYWRYSKLKFISWLPFIPDERDEGIELIKKAIRQESISKYMAMHQLIYILVDYGRSMEASVYASQILNVYPGSQFMLWAAAHAFDKNDNFEQAEYVYQKLDTLLSQADYVNPNHIVKCRMKLAGLYYRMNNHKACYETCNRLLTLLKDINVKDREDKIDDVRQILDECNELIQGSD